MNEDFNYKVLITTSGLGQRLGDVTKFLNKALVRVGEKPAISYIIESYPKEVEIVVTVGYLAEQVKDFLLLAYPDRQFTFVDVDLYQGPGSSLGYSMLKAKEKLQCPFVFHAADTIVMDKIVEPRINWSGGYKGEQSSMYSSFSTFSNSIKEIFEKGALIYDYLHIGLIGICEYNKFWIELESLYRANPNDQTLNDCRVINKMISGGSNFKVVEYSTWYDIGNVQSLNNARRMINDKLVNLDKKGEEIYLFDDFVIKFFADSHIVNAKCQHAEDLGELVPRIIDKRNNFFKYKKAQGDLYSRVVNANDFKKFLQWTKSNLWIEKKIVSDDEFKMACLSFYKDKTLARVQKYLLENSVLEKEHYINDELVPNVKDLLSEVDYEWLSSGLQSNYHGDFILDNIIKTSDGYKLIDWRQDFAGIIKSGDIYYDLAKINHNLTVNHDIIDAGLYSIECSDDKINIDINRKNVLVECQEELKRFVIDNGYNWQKVKVLTALIWLNMSPLHHKPFNDLLFNLGKINLYRELLKIKKLANNKKNIDEIRVKSANIKNIILDVDGVLNTGQFIYTVDGKFGKIFGAHDNDGLKMAAKFFNICAISADKRGWEITSKRVAEDMAIRLEYVPENIRADWLKDNFNLSESVYIADGMHDSLIFESCAFSVAPADAFYLAKNKASYITNAKAGNGAVGEACLEIIKRFVSLEKQSLLNINIFE